MVRGTGRSSARCLSVLLIAGTVLPNPFPYPQFRENRPWTLRPENAERAGLEEDLRGALAAGETALAVGAAPPALDVPRIHTLANAVLQYGTQLRAVYQQLHLLRDHLKDLKQWSALHRQAEGLLLEAYWAQLDLLAALGGIEMVVYPAMGGDLSVAGVAHRVLGIDFDVGRDRVETVFQQELQPFLLGAERRGAFEEWWRRITLLPKTAGTAGDAPEFHRFIQDARDEGRPVTLFLKEFTQYVENRAEHEAFLNAVEPQLHAGDFVVLWGRDLPLADRFRRLGYVEALDSLGVPTAIRETLRQADGLLEERWRIYNRDAQLYLHFARPFVILQKPPVPRAGLEEAAARMVRDAESAASGRGIVVLEAAGLEETPALAAIVAHLDGFASRTILWGASPLAASLAAGNPRLQIVRDAAALGVVLADLAATSGLEEHVTYLGLPATATIVETLARRQGFTFTASPTVSVAALLAGLGVPGPKAAALAAGLEEAYRAVLDVAA